MSTITVYVSIKRFIDCVLFSRDWDYITQSRLLTLFVVYSYMLIIGALLGSGVDLLIDPSTWCDQTVLNQTLNSSVAPTCAEVQSDLIAYPIVMISRGIALIAGLFPNRTRRIAHYFSD